MTDKKLAIIPKGAITEKGACFGDPCPNGMVQVAFVDCYPENRINDHGWGPQKEAFIDVYVDGKRFRIEIGDVESTSGFRRGIHVIGPSCVSTESYALNAVGIYITEERFVCPLTSESHNTRGA